MGGRRGECECEERGEVRWDRGKGGEEEEKKEEEEKIREEKRREKGS